MNAVRYYLTWLLLLAWGGRTATAQTISNGNFELWASPGGAPEAPTGWLTTDFILGYYNNVPAGSYFNTGTVTKSTEAHGGSFAAKISTLSLPTNSGGAVVHPGWLVLGAQPGLYDYAGLPNAGVPCTTRPTQLQFYYKLTGPATDSASALVYVTRTVAGVPTLLGVAFQYLQPTTSYTLLTMPLDYSSGDVPDSVHIQLSSGDARVITAGTTLLVDDMALINPTLATRAGAATQDLVQVAPNPSPAGRFLLSSPAQPDLAAAPLAVFDVTGRLVQRQPAQAVPGTGRTLDLSGLPLGIYTLRLDTKQGSIVRQLVVR
jgi:hypothetical protein